MKAPALLKGPIKISWQKIIAYSITLLYDVTSVENFNHHDEKMKVKKLNY
jgi:hypothetical protein